MHIYIYIYTYIYTHVIIFTRNLYGKIAIFKFYLCEEEEEEEFHFSLECS